MAAGKEKFVGTCRFVSDDDTVFTEGKRIIRKRLTISILSVEFTQSYPIKFVLQERGCGLDAVSKDAASLHIV